MYDLIQKKRGKETLLMTDTLPNVNKRMKALRASHRKKGDEYSFFVRPSDSASKFKKPSHDGGAWRGGGYSDRPQKIK